MLLVDARPQDNPAPAGTQRRNSRPAFTSTAAGRCLENIMPRWNLTPAERFWAKVRITPTCWIWNEKSRIRGRGYFFLNGKTILASRAVWEIERGPIPEGLCVLHHCDNPACVKTKPDAAYPEGHLFLGTQADNIADMVAKGRNCNQKKSSCSRGHEYADANIYRRPDGSRVCRECHRIHNRAAKARLKLRGSLWSYS